MVKKLILIPQVMLHAKTLSNFHVFLNLTKDPNVLYLVTAAIFIGCTIRVNNRSIPKWEGGLYIPLSILLSEQDNWQHLSNL